MRVVQAVNLVSNAPRYAGTMTMTREAASVDVATRVDIRAENVPPGISAEDHAVGRDSSLASLGAYQDRWTPEGCPPAVEGSSVNLPRSEPATLAWSCVPVALYGP